MQRMLMMRRCIATTIETSRNVPSLRPMSAIIRFQCGDDTQQTKQFHTFSYNRLSTVSKPPRIMQSLTNLISISKRQRTMIPRKAALALTPKARDLFQKMIQVTNSQGIILKYEISSQHALRMAFKFDLIKDITKELDEQDEGVSLQVLEDGITPKPPSEAWDDGLPKLYIHHAAFMKVLGGTLDVDFNSETGEMKPILFDREGNEMEPNA